MAFIDKLGRQDINGINQMVIPSSSWSALLHGYANGVLTKTQIVTELNRLFSENSSGRLSFQVGDNAGLDTFLARIDALSAVQKASYFSMVHPWNILLETEVIDRATYATALGI